MVKVVEKTLEEKAREETLDTLFKITTELLGPNTVTKGFNGFGFFVEDIQISLLGGREIQVPEEKYFDTAMQLAEAYETATGKEWTVKKNY